MTDVIAIAERVKKGETTAVAVAEQALLRIDAQSDLNAFLTVAREEVMDQARAVDAKRARGETLGPLAGVPIAIAIWWNLNVQLIDCDSGDVPLKEAEQVAFGGEPPNRDQRRYVASASVTNR